MNQILKWVLVLSLSSLLLISCNILNSNEISIDIISDRSSNKTGEEVTITIQNNSKKGVFFISRCDLTGEFESIVVEEKVGDDWQEIARPLGCAGYTPPILISQGDNYSINVMFDKPGVYRYRFGIYKIEDGKGLLPISQRQSNTFTIED